MLRVVERLFLFYRTGSGRPVPRQSLRLVSWAWQALRSVLMPVARESPSFPLALGDEGQWKGTSFVEDPIIIRNNRNFLNAFQARKVFCSGIVEGLYTKAKVSARKTQGFKAFKTLELALYHNLGVLPEPKIAHKFF